MGGHHPSTTHQKQLSRRIHPVAEQGALPCGPRVHERRCVVMPDRPGL